MTVTLPVILAIICLVVVSAALQRLTGLGFAMMMSPFLVVMVGPHGGVMLTNILSFLAPALMIPVVWKDIDWRRLAILAPAAVVVMPLFGWVAAVSPQGPLYIVVASLVLLGLSMSLIISRINKPLDGFATRALSGAGAGAGVILAGVGGPAMTVYSVLSRMNIRVFAATLQPLWVLMSVGGFLTKLTFSGNEVPAFPWWFWLGSMVAILIGMRVGTMIRVWFSDDAARKTVLVLAFIGAGLALLTGVRETFGL